MAGPVCVVLVRQIEGDPERVALDELIRLVGNYREGEDFWVDDTSAIGGTYCGELQPFIGSLDSPEHEPDDLVALDSTFGWVPTRAVTLSAMCNGTVDHRILGEMILWLAVKLDGIVDFCGQLDLPPSTLGRVAKLPYLSFGGEQHFSVFADQEALRSWLQSPSFHMVK